MVETKCKNLQDDFVEDFYPVLVLIVICHFFKDFFESETFFVFFLMIDGHKIFWIFLRFFCKAADTLDLFLIFLH